MSMADRVAVMRDGRILQDAAPEVVYDEPADTFVADFVGRTNLFRGRVVELDAREAVIETADGWRLVGRRHQVDLQVGHDAAVSVRPERLTIAASAKGQPPAPNHTAVTGRIVARTFLGDHVAYRLVSDATGPMEAWQPRTFPGIEGLPAPGDDVTVAWDPAAARVIPDTLGPDEGSTGSDPLADLPTPDPEEETRKEPAR